MASPAFAAGNLKSSLPLGNQFPGGNAFCRPPRSSDGATERTQNSKLKSQDHNAKR
jgi:hypothetical protein